MGEENGKFPKGEDREISQAYLYPFRVTVLLRLRLGQKELIGQTPCQIKNAAIKAPAPRYSQVSSKPSHAPEAGIGRIWTSLKKLHLGLFREAWL